MFESTVVCGRIALGIQGEHHARKVSFSETAIWKERFGEGTFELLHQRNGDVAPYPIVMTMENDMPYWYVTNSDTAVAGVGKCELRYIVDDVVIKSCTFITDVMPSLVDASEEIPEPQKAWVDQVLKAAQEVEDAVVHCPIIGENGNWLVWDDEKDEYVDTGVKCSGDIPTKLSQLEADSVSGEAELNISAQVLNIGASALTLGGGSIHISKTDYGFYLDGNRIQSVGDPEDSTDAANRKYVDEAVKGIDIPDVSVPTKLSELEADSISGEAELNISAQVLNIGASALHLTGSGISFGKTDYGFSVSGNVIKEVGEPQSDTDAANKEYVDGLIGDIDTALDGILAIENALIGGDAV